MNLIISPIAESTGIVSLSSRLYLFAHALSNGNELFRNSRSCISMFPDSDILMRCFQIFKELCTRCPYCSTSILTPEPSRNITVLSSSYQKRTAKGTAVSVAVTWWCILDRVMLWAWSVNIACAITTSRCVSDVISRR